MQKKKSKAKRGEGWEWGEGSPRRQWLMGGEGTSGRGDGPHRTTRGVSGGTALTGPPGVSQGGRSSQNHQGRLRGDGPHRTPGGVSGDGPHRTTRGVSGGMVFTGPRGGGCQSGEPQSWRGIRASAGSVDTSFQDLLSRGVEKWSVRDGGEADEVGGGEMVSEGRRWGRRGFLLR